MFFRIRIWSVYILFNNMQVKTTGGIVEGEMVNNEISGIYYSFKGIPYAAPPVGDLRFKAPQPPEPWEGVRSAKQHQDICYQFNFMTRLREKGSEDCLYLNVYTPQVQPAQPLPVMIWIHGGAFCCGSGNDDTYGPDFLIRQGVILVTLNYRLEALGFLSLKSEKIPGNAGAKDQVAAMKWVNKNIANFGGDSNNVTLFGQSAGAACVTYHCVSSMTKGLFRRAIAQSGSLASWWALGFRARDRAISLARKLNFESEDDEELYQFFKNQPIESLVECFTEITFAEKCGDKLETQYSVVIENVFPNEEAFFTGDIINALKNNIHEGVELMLGYNQDEGLINLAVSYNIKDTIFSANYFDEYYVFKTLVYNCNTNDKMDIGRAVRNFYLNGRDLNMRNLDLLAKYFAADMYKYGLMLVAKYFADKHKVYFYKFTCKSERNFFAKVLGVSEYFKNPVVSHIDEIAYLFPIKNIKQVIDKTSETFKMIDTVCKFWTNFAKNGNPTPDANLGVVWPQFRADMQSYLDIGNKVTRGRNPDKEEFIFLEKLFKKYLPEYSYENTAK